MSKKSSDNSNSLGLNSPIRITTHPPTISSSNSIKTPELSILSKIPGFSESPKISRERTPSRTPSRTPERENLLPLQEERSMSPKGYPTNKKRTLPIVGEETPSILVRNEESIAQGLARIAQEEGIEQKLLEKGYNILSKILVNSEDMTKARYLEVINPRGQHLFIELDLDGIVALRDDDATLIEGQMGTAIPYSSKMGAIQCADGMCGIAFVCEDGICTLEKSGIDETTENTFIFSGKERKGKMSNEPIPYPIIRLSEVEANPEAVTQTIEEITRRIRSGPYQSCIKNLDEMEKDLVNFENNFSRFRQAQKEAASAINSSLQELEKIYNLYRSHPPEDDQSQERYHQLIYNIQCRHETALVILDACSAVSKKRDKLKKWSEMIEEASSIIDKIAKDAPYII